jgi:hypothetical protein
MRGRLASAFATGSLDTIVKGPEAAVQLLECVVVHACLKIGVSQIQQGLVHQVREHAPIHDDTILVVSAGIHKDGYLVSENSVEVFTPTRTEHKTIPIILIRNSRNKSIVEAEPHVPPQLCSTLG